MKTTLKTFSIICIILGALAIIDSIESGIAAFIGGGLFLTQGILSLVYIGQQNKEYDISELK